MITRFAFTYAVHPSDLSAFKEAVRKEHEEQKYFNLQYRIIRPDGTIKWIWSRNFPSMNKKGQIIHTVGIAEDITEYKNAEIELRESEERYKSIFRNSPIGSCTG